MNIKDLIRDNIKNLAPYSTARDEYQGDIGIYLDANENPYDNGVNRYPDPHQKELKQRISQIKGVPTTQIFIGNGSDEPIDLVFRVFCEPRKHNAISISPTYGMYKVAAAINDVEMREVALESDFTLDTNKLLAAADENSRLLFICSPNNPTGGSFPYTQLVEIITKFKGVVVLDEAYIDFCECPGLLPDINSFKNLIILQTLSKAYGMAGLRLGLAFAEQTIIETLSQVKYPYNINIVTQKMVIKQLNIDISDQVSEIVSERKRVAESISKLSFVREVFPSDANFILVKVDSPRETYNTLINSGIIVRDRSRIKGCEGTLRITIGNPDENNRLIKIMNSLETI